MFFALQVAQDVESTALKERKNKTERKREMDLTELLTAYHPLEVLISDKEFIPQS